VAHPGSIVAEVGATTTVVRLRGQIDSALREQASRAMGRSLTAGLPVVLDASRIEFIDSTGIAFFVQCRRACVQVGLDCHITDAPARVVEVLRMLGLEDYVLGVRAAQAQPRSESQAVAAAAASSASWSGARGSSVSGVPSRST
jgi:anti-anti-sigma factor